MTIGEYMYSHNDGSPTDLESCVSFRRAGRHTSVETTCVATVVSYGRAYVNAAHDHWLLLRNKTLIMLTPDHYVCSFSFRFCTKYNVFMIYYILFII